MSEQKICDLCEQDGEFNRAIGWYTARDDVDYDVCEKHAVEVKKVGFKVELY